MGKTRTWPGTSQIMATRKRNAAIIVFAEVKKQVKDELLEFQNTYSIMDDLFSREIKSVEIGKRRLCYFFPTSLRKKLRLHKIIYTNLNPVCQVFFFFD